MPNKALPSYEKSLNEKFSGIYDTLRDLKNNRNKFINSKQIYQIYDEFLNYIHELTITRKDEELKGMSLNLPNSNDVLIDDIWQLLSLCFVTCGLIKFAPATYSSMSTVYKLLSHLKEGKCYSINDLEPIKKRLDEFKEIISNSKNEDNEYSMTDEINHKAEETLILRRKLNKCEELYKELERKLEDIPSDLESVCNELVAIRKALLGYLTTSTTNSNNVILQQLAPLKESLKKIESLRDSEGKFSSKVASSEQLDSTQIGLNALLDDCHNFINDLLIQNDSGGDISNLLSSMSISDDATKIAANEFKNLYNELIDIKYKLENLLITRRWTMRETDLYTYQKALKLIDQKRIDLNGKISLSNKDIRRLLVLLVYLMRRCYSLIYKLLESSEPVSESLQPIHNQLSTVRKCLLEIKRVDGLNNLRELYPFQFKLASLDNLRDDGKFTINGTIPEGQGTLNALLAECFDIIHELKIDLEEKEDERGEVDSTSEFQDGDIMTDDEDKKSDDEVELKRGRYMGFNEADYDQDSESDYDSSILSDSEYEGNDYY